MLNSVCLSEKYSKGHRSVKCVNTLDPPPCTRNGLSSPRCCPGIKPASHWVANAGTLLHAEHDSKYHTAHRARRCVCKCIQHRARRDKTKGRGKPVLAPALCNPCITPCTNSREATWRQATQNFTSKKHQRSRPKVSFPYLEAASSLTLTKLHPSNAAHP